VLSKCANPDCGALFRYLKEGKVYVADYYEEGDVCLLGGVPHVAGKRSDRQEMFWLCGTCDRSLILAAKGNEVVVAQRGQKLPKDDRPLRQIRLAG